MIERLPIELNDIRPATFVIGVTVTALGANGIRAFAMKAPRLLTVPRDVLVAGQTKSRLRCLGEWLMAIRAFGLEFRVAFDECTRHDKLIEEALRGRGPDKYRGDQHKCKGSESVSGLQGRRLRSIAVNGDHVQDGRKDKQDKQGHVEDVPEGKQALVNAEPGGLVNGGEVE